MNNKIFHLDINHTALTDFSENYTFTLPPSDKSTCIEIFLYYNKTAKKIKAVCLRTDILEPNSTGLQSLLKHRSFFKEGGTFNTDQEGKFHHNIQKKALAEVHSTRPKPSSDTSVENSEEDKEDSKPPAKRKAGTLEKPNNNSVTVTPPVKKQKTVAKGTGLLASLTKSAGIVAEKPPLKDQKAFGKAVKEAGGNQGGSLGTSINTLARAAPFKRQKTVKQVGVGVRKYTRVSSDKLVLKQFDKDAVPLGKRDKCTYKRNPEDSSEGSLDKKDAEWTPKSERPVVRKSTPEKRPPSDSFNKAKLEGVQARIAKKVDCHQRNPPKPVIKEEKTAVQTTVTTTTTTTTGNIKYRGAGTEINPVVILGDPGELVTQVKVAQSTFSWE